MLDRSFGSAGPRLTCIQLLSRYLLLAATLFVLILFIALPTAPVNTYLSGSNCVWHISKASRASEIGIEGVGEIPAAEPRFQLQEPDSERTAVFHRVALFPILPQFLRAFQFRPPPLL